MSAKFTPGPWSVSTGQANIGGHGHKCWLVGQKDGDVGYAVVILPDEDDTPEARTEREATANLVAASPLLYEALEALHAVQNGPPLIRDAIVWQEAMDKAEAALRAARGEG